MNRIHAEFLENELWWGGTTSPMNEQGYDRESVIELDVSRLGRQSAPLYLSSMGRYIWADSPLTIRFDKGRIEAEGESIELVRAGDCLRDAYLGAMHAHFPFEDRALPDEFFRAAQFNSWMEFTYNPTQESVLRYAHSIIDSGYEPGVLIIDEGWHVHYGVWEFDFAKFPDPKAMIDELHSLGFTVLLWLVPYVTADGREFLEHYFPFATELARKPFLPRLCRQASGEPAILKWWEGFSAMLDMTKENDVRYLEEILRHLMEDYGVDGFKFDGGNIASIAPERWLTDPPTTSAEALNKAWNDFGAKYKFHEYKDTYDRGGRAMIERIRDRHHTWDDVNGLGSLVPIALMQGLLGYPYVCPDMVGGGEWQFNLDPQFKCDEELFVRMAECSALFPMIQFSWAPWRMLSDEGQRLCLDAARLHGRFADRIIRLVRECPKSGEPIMRCMEYSYPHAGFERVYDQFMLGDDILVAPVVTRGERVRRVVLPVGEWKYCDGSRYTGGQCVSVDAPLDTLPYFERISE